MLPQQLKSFQQNDYRHGKNDCKHFTEHFSLFLAPARTPKVTWSYPPGWETVLPRVIWEQGQQLFLPITGSQHGWHTSRTAAYCHQMGSFVPGTRLLQLSRRQCSMGRAVSTCVEWCNQQECWMGLSAHKPFQENQQPQHEIMADSTAGSVITRACGAAAS